MHKSIHLIVLCFVAALAFTACSNEEAVDVSTINKQTVIVYMPWTGDALSTTIFPQNLDSIEGAIKKAKGMTGKLVVFISKSATSSELYEVTYSNGTISHLPIKTYTGNDYTTAAGITQILNDVQANAYALNYAMMVGCHGCGWTFKDDWIDYPYQAKQHVVLPEDAGVAMAKSATSAGGAAARYPTTRFFGSVSDTNYATDITDFAAGIQAAGMKMQYIMFDDCYMANIETAYELRNVTNFLIGSTSEVMAIGVPYQTMWSALASATPNYETAITAFNTYYKAYAYPYGALSAIDCRQTNGLAALMKEINTRYQFDETQLDSLQVLDGFNSTIFYDLGSYVDHLCKSTSLLSDFRSQLDAVVRSTATTDSLYSYLYYGDPRFIKVNTYSGITISDPSMNSVSLKGIESTSWWQDTH